MRFINNDFMYVKERVSDGEGYYSGGFGRSQPRQRKKTETEILNDKVILLESEILKIKNILSNESVKSNEVIF